MWEEQGSKQPSEIKSILTAIAIVAVMAGLSFVIQWLLMITVTSK